MALRIRASKPGMWPCECAGRNRARRTTYFLKTPVTCLARTSAGGFRPVGREMLDGGGLGMLVFPASLAHDNNIH